MGVVLGIVNHFQSGASIVIDGKILGAVSEERFTGVKNDPSVPSQSLCAVLDQTNMGSGDVDVVSYGWSAPRSRIRHNALILDRIRHARSAMEDLSIVSKRIHEECRNNQAGRNQMRDFVSANFPSSDYLEVDHHECHALSAHLLSGFGRSLTLTCDGRGDYQSFTATLFDGDDQRILYQASSVDSLGFFYGRICRLLGFQPNKDEGKVASIAAHGDPSKARALVSSMISVSDGKIRSTCGSHYSPNYRDYSDELISKIGGYVPEDIAAATQELLEEVIGSIALQLLREVGPSDVCLAGGVFSNVRLNQVIAELTPVRRLFVLPCMGDGGLPLQSAVVGTYRLFGDRCALSTMKLGPEAEEMISPGTLPRARAAGVRVREPDGSRQVINEITDCLEQGMAVGLFRGRAEFGPRALCGRSIIADPRSPKTKDQLNHRLSRWTHMPFSPVMTDEAARRFLIGWRPDDLTTPFMTRTFGTTQEFQRLCPAAVHIDGTTRPQVIAHADDPFVYDMLEAWRERSGVGVVVNTSFNAHDAPVVNNGDDVIGALIRDVIDSSVICDRMVLSKR